MPNHVTNILTLVGNETDVNEVLKVLINEKGEIDFNLAVPMAEDLEGTTSPTKIITQAQYEEQKGTDTSFLGHGITTDMSREYIKKYGADNWYEWKLENWGTKWGGYDSYKIDDVTFGFQTAWATPTRYLEKISSLYPNVTFKVKYADEDMGYNVGEYHLLDSEYVFSEQPEGGSYDAYVMAVELNGSDDCWMVNDYLTDDIDDEEVESALDVINSGNESFEATAILLAYKYRKAYVDFPIKLSNYLLERAVEDEDYKYASELRDAMREKQKELE